MIPPMPLSFPKEAEKMGADAADCDSLRQQNLQAGLIKLYHMIADSVNIPIIVYNVPSRTDLCDSAPNLCGACQASEYLRNKGSERKYKRY